MASDFFGFTIPMATASVPEPTAAWPAAPLYRHTCENMPAPLVTTSASASPSPEGLTARVPPPASTADAMQAGADVEMRDAFCDDDLPQKDPLAGTPQPPSEMQASKEELQDTARKAMAASMNEGAALQALTNAGFTTCALPQPLFFLDGSTPSCVKLVAFVVQQVLACSVVFPSSPMPVAPFVTSCSWMNESAAPLQFGNIYFLRCPTFRDTVTKHCFGSFRDSNVVLAQYRFHCKNGCCCTTAQALIQTLQQRHTRADAAGGICSRASTTSLCLLASCTSTLQARRSSTSWQTFPRTVLKPASPPSPKLVGGARYGKPFAVSRWTLTTRRRFGTLSSRAGGTRTFITAWHPLIHRSSAAS